MDSPIGCSPTGPAPASRRAGFNNLRHAPATVVEAWVTAIVPPGGQSKPTSRGSGRMPPMSVPVSGGVLIALMTMFVLPVHQNLWWE